MSESTARKAPQQSNYISVSKLVQQFNATLERQYPQVLFEGEISKVTRAASGHIYFDLKDERSQIAAVMWRGMAQALTFTPKTGDMVLCHGKPNVYHARGSLQVVVHKMLPAGEGALQQKFILLKNKLEKEGLFSDQRKRELPFLPAAIGVVTSGSGAVIHDIMVKIRERMPNLKVYLEDARVQGEGAAQEIADGVNALSASGKVDVIVVARGGGSLEDLWPFNEELVVRAIFASRVPVISGVGHEVDITLSDLVADLRAPTPTAAAEMVMPQREELLEEIAELEERLLDLENWFMPLEQEVDELALRLDSRIGSLREEWRLQLEAARAKLASIHPDKVLQLFASRLSLLQERLVSAGTVELQHDRTRIDELKARLDSALSPQYFKAFVDKLNFCARSLHTGYRNTITSRQSSFDTLLHRLEALNPENVLDRGYSIVKRKGKILRSVRGLAKDDLIELLVKDGSADAKVLGTRKT